MHELSIALSLLEGINEAAERERITRVSSVRLRVGVLSGIAPDALRFSWDLASEDTIAAGSKLEIEEVPLVVMCQTCAARVTPLAGTGLVCPMCGSVCPNIVSGRELELVAMEVPT